VSSLRNYDSRCKIGFLEKSKVLGWRGVEAFHGPNMGNVKANTFWHAKLPQTYKRPSEILFVLIIACCVATLALGSQPRQGLAKVQAKSEAREYISCSLEFRKV
jgi:hypothetical protein